MRVPNSKGDGVIETVVDSGAQQDMLPSFDDVMTAEVGLEVKFPAAAYGMVTGVKVPSLKAGVGGLRAGLDPEAQEGRRQEEYPFQLLFYRVYTVNSWVVVERHFSMGGAPTLAKKRRRSLRNVSSCFR
jgi:hypothetical protein